MSAQSVKIEALAQAHLADYDERPPQRKYSQLQIEPDQMKPKEVPASMSGVPPSGLTDTLLRYEGSVKVLRVLLRFKTIPFRLDERSFHLSVLPFGLRLFAFYMLVGNILARWCIFVSWAPKILDAAIPMSQRMILVGLVILYSIGSTWIINIALFRSDFAFFFNSLAKLKQCGQHKDDFATFMFKRLITYSVYISFTICFLFTSGMSFYLPYSPLNTYLDAPTPGGEVFVVVTFFYNLMSDMTLSFLPIFYLILLLTYIAITKTWLTRLEADVDIIAKIKNQPILSAELNLFVWKHYKSLQILNKQFTRCFSPMLIPTTQAGLIVMCVIYNFCLVHLHDQFNFLITCSLPITSGVCLGLLKVLIPECVSVFTISTKIVAARKKYYRQHHSEYWVRSWGSCSPLKVKVGQLFYYTKVSTLKIYGLTFYWTLKSLLILKKMK